jgi:hypothetical protein
MSEKNWRNRGQEFWLTKGGYIAITTRNACGCCPNGYILNWLIWNNMQTNMKIQSLYYTFKNRRHFLKWAKDKFLEKLK